MKWSFPHVVREGILCSMASFEQHGASGFWKGQLLAGPGGGALEASDAAMGRFGRVSAVSDLPRR